MTAALAHALPGSQIKIHTHIQESLTLTTLPIITQASNLLSGQVVKKMTAKTALGNAGFYLLGFFLPSTLLSSQLITSHVTSGAQMRHRQQKGQELLQASDDLIKARWDTCSRQKQPFSVAVNVTKLAV